MIKNLIDKRRQFQAIFLVVFLMGLFLTPGFIRAARQDIVDECKNQDTCPGMCRLDARFIREAVDQRITLYNEGQIELGSYKDAKGNPWKLLFIFSKSHCGLGYYSPNVNVNGQQEAEKVIAARTTNLPAFCCCKAEQGGNVSCKRWVNRDLTAAGYPMKCEDSYTAREDKDGKGANCKSFERRVIDSSVPSINVFDEVKKLNQLPAISSPAELIGVFIRILLAFIGSLALVLYVWAGVLWMGAAGNSERIEKAKHMLAWTTLGVAVMLGAYVIVQYIFGIF